MHEKQLFQATLVSFTTAKLQYFMMNLEIGGHMKINKLALFGAVFIWSFKF